MQRLVLILLVIVSCKIAFANEEDSLKAHKGPHKVLDFFRQGHLSGQIRNFTMSTINDGPLNDYLANAIGASIHYETKQWRGLKLGLNGLFVYKGFSNDLLAIDSLAEKPSNYELQLFDIEHPGNYNDLDRLEELYVNYQFKDLNVRLGKMEIETPIVNKHDGRMKPKVFMGARAKYEMDGKYFFAGWFTKASPRSITHWYSIGESIGLYNNGCLPDGNPAEYHQKISSDGLGIMGTKLKVLKGFNLSLWDYYIENVSNTALVNPYFEDSSVYIGVMYLNQTGIKHGGNENFHSTYYNNQGNTHVISARIMYKQFKHRIQLNASHIFEGSKFIFPRELGMDPLYTFISRSQMEGFGNASAYTLAYVYEHKNLLCSTHLNKMKVSKDFEHNKYDIPSYWQFNLDLKYHFLKLMEGLDFRVLYIYRWTNDKEISAKQIFNKVNFHQFNLILNFNF